MTRSDRIRATLEAALAPSVLDIENESRAHNVPAGSETHFKVLVVSPRFDGLGRIDRHRLVHDILKDELATGLHALTLRALSPTEAANDAGTFASPACLGGDGSLPARKEHEPKNGA